LIDVWVEGELGCVAALVVDVVGFNVAITEFRVSLSTGGVALTSDAD
jgi:hypothetical protein